MASVPSGLYLCLEQHHSRGASAHSGANHIRTNTQTTNRQHLTTRNEEGQISGHHRYLEGTERSKNSSKNLIGREEQEVNEEEISKETGASRYGRCGLLLEKEVSRTV